MKKILFALLGLIGFLGFFTPAEAASLNLTYHYEHFLFTITTAEQQNWQQESETWTYNGTTITPPAQLRVDGDDVPPLPEGFAKHMERGFSIPAIEQTIQTSIANELDRPAGSVVISTSSTGAILFDGVGFPSRTVDVAAAAEATEQAVTSGIADIILPVTETPPTVTVTDPTLQKEGVKELVTIGESDFSNSPTNRRHNIAVGLGKFQGHLIPQGSVFSFDQTLGTVDGTTGYVKELVIKGDETIPDYGGGLCQVSTTAYRGVWEYGFPIVKRINHSYMVGHYAPQGTDATVYPPNIDMKFRNDSPGALVIQTYAADDKAYFLYYGTKDARQSEVLGPFVWAMSPPPPDRTQLTLDLPPGEKKKVGDRVPGEYAAWFRTTTQNDKTTTQGTYSIYEPRPLYYLVGTATLPPGETGATLPKVFLDE